MDRQHELLQFAEGLARQAGSIIREYFDKADKGIQLKPDHSPVTEADKIINQLVIDTVAKSYPSHGVLAEEGSSHEDRRELWVCDPIDGTKGLIQRIPVSLFSLAFVVDGEPEVAVICDPFQDKLFSAVKGGGAKVNGKKLVVSKHVELAGASVAFSSTYSGIQTRRSLHDNLSASGAMQLLIPGNVFKSTLVASGHADGYIFPGRSAHDVAAAKLIVEEAGGRVTDLNGGEQCYDGKIYGAIITNGTKIHDDLVRLVAEFGAENLIGY